MKIKAILSGLRSRFQELYKDRLVQLILFGSQARKEVEVGSDVDVLVVLQGEVHPGEEIARTGEITAALSLRYDTVISCIFVSATRFTNEQNPLFLNIHREGVAL